MSNQSFSVGHKHPTFQQSTVGIGQKINLLGNAQKSGMNLSRMINTAASVRAGSKHGPISAAGAFRGASDTSASAKSVLNNTTLSALRQNYSAIHEFAQDQLTQISRKELVQEKLRMAELDKQLSKNEKHMVRLRSRASRRNQQHTASQTRVGGGDTFERPCESVLSYISQGSTGDQSSHAMRSSTKKSQYASAMRGGGPRSSSTAHPHSKGDKISNLYGQKQVSIGKQCSEVDCHRPTYKERQCRHHLAQRIKKAFRYHLKNMYRGPEQAFNNFDFTGKGYILEKDILSSPIMQRIKFARQDVTDSFKILNLFNNVSRVSALKDGVPPNGMSFDKFREIFFPQLHILDEENQSDEDRDAKEMARQYSRHKDKQQDALAERIHKLDLKIQAKIAENYEKVRKAFLALDKNFDGVVDVEDFLAHFATDPSIEFDELQKLLKIKDRNGEGKIDFNDFSKWFGSAIHKSEGFYFRHDGGRVNPPHDLHAKRFKMRFPEKDLEKCREAYNDELIKNVLEKMYIQWKTMRKAFMGLDCNKEGHISQEGLRFYLTHWGVTASPQKFQELFSYFDADGDGKISYKDFQATAGKEMQPDQGAYWRQDMPRQTRIKSCKSDHCWQVAQDFSSYCKIHLRMVQSKAFLLMQDMKKRLGSAKWAQFIDLLRVKADPEDREQLFVDEFIDVVRYMRLKLSQSQIDMLNDCFPGRKEGDRKRIKVGRFYDLSVAIEHQQTYKTLKVKKTHDGVNDASGYTGQMHRRKPHRLVQKEPEPLTEAELIALFLKDSKMAQMIRYCREIDPAQNGVVTVVELDDILRILYEQELEGKDLSDLYEPFCQVQNKILVDYRSFKDFINGKLRQIDTNFQVGGSTTQMPLTSGQTSQRLTPANATAHGRFGFSMMSDELQGGGDRGDEMTEQDVQDYFDNEQARKQMRSQGPSSRMDQHRASTSQQYKSGARSSVKKSRGATVGQHNQSVMNHHHNQSIFSTLGGGDLRDSIGAPGEPQQLDEAHNYSQSIMFAGQTIQETKKANQGLVAVKELLSATQLGHDRSRQSHSEMGMGMTPQNNFARRHHSNVNEGKLRYNTLQGDDFSPYDNLKQDGHQHDIDSVSPMHRNLAQRPASTLNKDGSSTFLLKNALFKNFQSSRKQQFNSQRGQETQQAPKRGKSLAALGSTTHTPTMMGCLEEQGSKRSAAQAKAKMNQTIDEMRFVTSEGDLAPLQEIVENEPFEFKKRLGTANGTREKKLSVRQDSRQSSRHHAYSSTMFGVPMTRTAPSVTSSKGLQNSSRAEDLTALRKDNIKAKVAYEWKQIFKNLTKFDPKQSGTVIKSDFQKACQLAGVSLSNDEVRRVGMLFGRDGYVDFIRMSRELNLHYSSLNYVANRANKIENLKEVISKSGASEMKQLSTHELRQMIQTYQAKLDRQEQRQSSMKSRQPLTAQVTSGDLKMAHSPSLQSASATAKSLSKHAQMLNLQKTMPTRATSMQTTLEDKRRVSMSSKLLTREIQNEIVKRSKVQTVLNQRREEFADLVHAFLKRKGVGSLTSQQAAEMLSNNEFKQILQAFGLKLTPQEFKNLIANQKLLDSTASSTHSSKVRTNDRLQGRRQLAGARPTLDGYEVSAFDDVASAATFDVKIVGGYPRMTPLAGSRKDSHKGHFAEVTISEKISQRAGAGTRGPREGAAAPYSSLTFAEKRRLGQSNRSLSGTGGVGAALQGNFQTLSHNNTINARDLRPQISQT